MALDEETIAEILARTHPQAKIAAPAPIEVDEGVELSDAVTPDLSELRSKYLPDDVLAADSGDDNVAADEDVEAEDAAEVADDAEAEQTWVDIEVGDAEPKSMLIDDETQSIILEQG